MRKKIVSMLLCLVMVLSLMPTVAFAADIASGEGWNLSDDGVLHITGAVPASGFGLTNNQKEQVKSVVTTPEASIVSGKDLFFFFDNMTSADLSKLDTSKATDMDNMFTGCKSLTSLDVSGFDTSSVTSMFFMFSGCKSLTSLDVSGFDTSKVTNMSGMFSGCESLTSLDVSGFDTSKVTDMDAMFDGCSSLTSLDVSHFDTSKVADMYRMFRGCRSLASLDISGFDTSSLLSNRGDEMLVWCFGLTSIGINSELLAKNSYYLMLTSRVWYNKDTNEKYDSKEALNAITDKVTLVVKSYDVWVGGVQVNDANKDDVLGDDTVSFDPDTNTLTIEDGAGITGTYSNALIYAKRTWI